MTINITGTVDLNPGTPSHQREVVTAYLKSKGIPTEQEYQEGEPVHRIVISVKQ